MDEDHAKNWLEHLADRNMAGGDRYGGLLPVIFPESMPEDVTGFGKELVIEFHVTLPDGKQITTTRPLGWKDL